MELFLDTIIANPFLLLQVIFALCAGVALVLFIAGFFGGVSNLFTMSENSEHLSHAHVRAVHGALLLFILFVVWELLRWIGGLF